MGDNSSTTESFLEEAKIGQDDVKIGTGKDDVCIRIDVEQGALETLANSMWTCYNQSKFCDVKLVVGREKILLQAHRVVLVGACEYFTKLFEYQKDDTIECLDKFDSSAVIVVIKYLYLRILTFKKDQVQQVLEVLDYMGITEALPGIEKYLLGQVTFTNCIYYCDFAVKYSLQQLRSHSVTMLVRCFSEKAKTEELFEINFALLKEIVSNHNLAIPCSDGLVSSPRDQEMALLRIIQRYATYLAGQEGMDTAKIIQQLKPCLLMSSLKQEVLSAALSLTLSAADYIEAVLYGERFVNITTEERSMAVALLTEWIEDILSRHDIREMRRATIPKLYRSVIFSSKNYTGYMNLDRVDRFQKYGDHQYVSGAIVFTRNRHLPGELEHKLICGIIVSYNHKSLEPDVYNEVLAASPDAVAEEFVIAEDERITKVRCHQSPDVIHGLEFFTNVGQVYLTGQRGGFSKDDTPPQYSGGYLTFMNGYSEGQDGLPNPGHGTLLNLQSVWSYYGPEVPEKDSRNDLVYIREFADHQDHGSIEEVEIQEGEQVLQPDPVYVEEAEPEGQAEQLDEGAGVDEEVDEGAGVDEEVDEGFGVDDDSDEADLSEFEDFNDLTTDEEAF